MNSVSRVKVLCKERKIPIYKLEKDLGYANGYVGQLKKGTFPDDRLFEIARYLGVTTEYLLTGAETERAPAEPGRGNVDMKLGWELSTTEQFIIEKLRLLNDSGQQRVLDYISDLLCTEIYKNQPENYPIQKNA